MPHDEHSDSLDLSHLPDDAKIPDTIIVPRHRPMTQHEAEVVERYVQQTGATLASVRASGVSIMWWD